MSEKNKKQQEVTVEMRHPVLGLRELESKPEVHFRVSPPVLDVVPNVILNKSRHEDKSNATPARPTPKFRAPEPQLKSENESARAAVLATDKNVLGLIAELNRAMERAAAAAAEPARAKNKSPQLV